MKSIVMLLAVLVGLSGTAPAGSPPLIRHLVYEFGYNTKVAKQGPGRAKPPSISMGRRPTAAC